MQKGQLQKRAKDVAVHVHSVVFSDQTIDEALLMLRQKEIHDKILYFYVLDRTNHLVGVVSTRDLLLNKPETKIKDIMVEAVITLHEDQTLQQAMEIMQTNRLLAVPVVDSQKRFLGTIDVNYYLEESIDIANTKKSQQVFQLLGFVLDEGRQTSTWKSYSMRMPWIFCNMLGGLGCAVISNFYEIVLSKVIILAMFIPLVLSLSESISMQAMTQSLSYPSMREFRKESMIGLIFRQWRLFVLLGATCGLIVGATSTLWGGGIGPSITILISISVSIFITATIGSAIPVVLHVKKLDPKVASGPLVLMLADIITTGIYLTLATYLLL